MQRIDPEPNRIERGHHTGLSPAHFRQTSHPEPPIPMNPRLPDMLDIQDFSRQNSALSGELPVAALPRLAESVEPDSGPVHWSFVGHSVLRADGSREARAQLMLSGALRLRCTRCLQVMDCPMDEQRDYRFVPSEAQAQSEDAQDDECDVLATSHKFDLAGLIEDETLMALPLVPRHAQCLRPAMPDEITAEPASAPAAPEAPSAWSRALSGLRSQVRGEQDDAKD